MPQTTKKRLAPPAQRHQDAVERFPHMPPELTIRIRHDSSDWSYTDVALEVSSAGNPYYRGWARWSSEGLDLVSPADLDRLEVAVRRARLAPTAPAHLTDRGNFTVTHTGVVGVVGFDGSVRHYFAMVTVTRRPVDGAHRVDLRLVKPRA